MIRDVITEGATRFDQSDADGMADTHTDDTVLTAATGERAEGERAIRDYATSACSLANQGAAS